MRINFCLIFISHFKIKLGYACRIILTKILDGNSPSPPPHNYYKNYKPLEKRIFINNQIRAEKVRLIDEKGEQIGIIETKNALDMARARNLDLIQVTDKTEPPVCKLGEYGKYLYSLRKKEIAASDFAMELLMPSSMLTKDMLKKMDPSSGCALPFR